MADGEEKLWEADAEKEAGGRPWGQTGAGVGARRGRGQAKSLRESRVDVADWMWGTREK